MDQVNFEGVLDYHPSKLVMVPRPQRETARRYIEYGQPPGAALRAIIADEPISRITVMDEELAVQLQSVVRFFNNHAPSLCYGDAQKVTLWQSLGGLDGYLASRKGENI
jgi:hypothetical protein